MKHCLDNIASGSHTQMPMRNNIHSRQIFMKCNFMKSKHSILPLLLLVTISSSQWKKKVMKFCYIWYWKCIGLNVATNKYTSLKHVHDISKKRKYFENWYGKMRLATEELFEKILFSFGEAFEQNSKDISFIFFNFFYMYDLIKRLFLLCFNVICNVFRLRLIQLLFLYDYGFWFQSMHIHEW